MVPEDVGAAITPSSAEGMHQPATLTWERPSRAVWEQPGPRWGTVHPGQESQAFGCSQVGAHGLLHPQKGRP